VQGVTDSASTSVVDAAWDDLGSRAVTNTGTISARALRVRGERYLFSVGRLRYQRPLKKITRDDLARRSGRTYASRDHSPWPHLTEPLPGSFDLPSLVPYRPEHNELGSVALLYELLVVRSRDWCRDAAIRPLASAAAHLAVASIAAFWASRDAVAALSAHDPPPPTPLDVSAQLTRCHPALAGPLPGQGIAA
jgi:hypothetical protein